MVWSVEDRASYVVVRTLGVFTLQTYREMVADITDRSFWRPGRDVLFDHRLLAFGRADFDTMFRARDIHQAHDDKIGGGRAAVLMAGLADYGLGRIFEALATGHVSAKLSVFTSEPRAVDWLSEPLPPGDDEAAA